ncbi:NADH:ubiquinone oxidoreductase, NADH-binding (51 kD) subunit [Rhodococcus ruber BKS 20-38]|uniref:NADH:ubiquinone oxidoreductase, NADH-binding (51 kD) subunit n=1 Tax=Rhodococcus ruber BKS 20-38 TaxID=1278076 RepID=M2YZ40_9NOCA|nr:NADH:ubiquinone oxidoreductase, NADH-binding (51 kD) subunit [Rhodococcus ruber BKS 20-38]
MLDGLRLAAAAARSTKLYIYLSDRHAQESIELAVAELAAVNDLGFQLDVTVVKVDPAYVAGEETAAVQAINGGRALPTDKPPRPFEAGVNDMPTVVSNVETLANLPFIQQFGVEEYRSLGTVGSPGTFLLTLSAPTCSGLYEVPFGTTLREVLEWLGENTTTVNGVLVGGYFAGVADASVMDLPLDYDAYAGAGSGLGCGAMVVLGADTCPVTVSAAVLQYFGKENAGQCGSCFNGTAAMAAVVGALRDQSVTIEDMNRLRHWSSFLRGRGACGTLDGAANVVLSLLRDFPDLVSAHEGGTCTLCAAPPLLSYPPYAVSAPALNI